MMMIRTISIFILITGLVAKNYLIEVADEGGDEGETEIAGEAGESQGDYQLGNTRHPQLFGQYGRAGCSG